MGRKRKNAITIDFSNGEASQHVTGSCIWIHANEFNILLECGLSQSNNIKNDYLANKEKFNFKCNELDYVFCMHAHADHSARIPLLYARGCNAPLIVPKDTTEIFSNMTLDSAHIIERDSEYLSRVFARDIDPLYTAEDVHNTISHLQEYPIGEVIKLNDNISFKFVNSGHIIAGTQILLWLTSGNTTKKIIYTSDLGNDLLTKHYVEPFEPLDQCDLLIGETTYGDPTRAVSNAVARKKDLEKLKTIIQQECIDQKHKVLIPVFALDRLPEILTELYLMYHDDENFRTPIVIDTPLGLAHLKTYFHILQGDKLDLLQKVLEWDNIVQVNTFEESKGWATSGRSCIVLASSGMLTAGRSLLYAEHMINDEHAFVIFCGYATEGSIGWKIKHPKDYKYIEINGKRKRNLCGVADLHSFSSHMQYPSLLKYYSNINCNQIALVHGQMDSKIPFAEKLRETLANKNKTTKVSVVNKSTVINI